MIRVPAIFFAVILVMGACSKNSSDTEGSLSLDTITFEGQHIENPPHDAVTVRAVVRSSYNEELKNVRVGVVIVNSTGRAVGTHTSTPITMAPGGSDTVDIHVSPLTGGTSYTDITEVRLTPYCEHGAGAEVSINPREQ